MEQAVVQVPGSGSVLDRAMALLHAAGPQQLTNSPLRWELGHGALCTLWLHARPMQLNISSKRAQLFLNIPYQLKPNAGLSDYTMTLHASNGKQYTTSLEGATDGFGES